MKIVPDSSALIEALISSKAVSAKQVIVHETLLQSIEADIKENKAQAFMIIEELEKLRSMADKKQFKLIFSGGYKKLPANIDALSRDLAHDEDATLLTADPLMEKIAKAKGVDCILERKKRRKLLLDNYFDNKTMSVHLRENVRPFAKRGKPGKWSFDEIDKIPLLREEIDNISREIIEEAKVRQDGFIEIERPGSTIVQLASYRIVITRPPFSDGWEITAVRPVAKLKLKDYKLNEKLQERISKKAEGILIAGSPGMGKSTFAAALAEHYSEQKKIVKTVEAPRDLVLPEKITQYAISHADSQEIHDILLLSRPDYTFFDEMRNTDDFRLFADLRLAGIGFIGIVHATNPIDAVQRFVGRIELGVIPQVIDTVIFIQDGQVAKVLGLQMVVKVPSGMTEADLARPVVVVSDFETKKPEFELYSYGEETVVIPVGEEKKSPAHALAGRQLEQEIGRHYPEVEVEVISDERCIVCVPEQDIPKLIGKQGKNISELEKKYGFKIDVRPLGNKAETIKYDAKIMSKSIIFQLKKKHANKELEISVNGDYLMTAKVSKKGVIKVKKNNKISRIIEDALNTGEAVELR